MDRVLELVPWRRRVDRHRPRPSPCAAPRSRPRRVEFAEGPKDAAHQSCSPGVSASNATCSPVTRMPCWRGRRTGGGTISLISEIGDHRQLLDEEQEPHEEPAEAAQEDRAVDERRRRRPAIATARTRATATGTMITKRSNHMPRLMNSERMNSQVGLRRSLCENSDSGRIMLQVSMIHAAHHHWPNTRFHQYCCSTGVAAEPADEELVR